MERRAGSDNPVTRGTEPRRLPASRGARAAADRVAVSTTTRGRNHERCLQHQPKEWSRSDSNRRPTGCKPVALPTELRPLLLKDWEPGAAASAAAGSQPSALPAETRSATPPRPSPAAVLHPRYQQTRHNRGAEDVKPIQTHLVTCLGGTAGMQTKPPIGLRRPGRPPK